MNNQLMFPIDEFFIKNDRIDISLLRKACSAIGILFICGGVIPINKFEFQINTNEEVLFAHSFTSFLAKNNKEYNTSSNIIYAELFHKAKSAARNSHPNLLFYDMACIGCHDLKDINRLSDIVKLKSFL